MSLFETFRLLMNLNAGQPPGHNLQNSIFLFYVFPTNQH